MEGEARKVATAVGQEDGFKAWQKLKQRFEPGLQARRVQIPFELNAMIMAPAKNPIELANVIMEMD